MTKCILIFDDIQKSLDLLDSFKEKTFFLSENLLIIPFKEQISSHDQNLLEGNKSLNITTIDKVRILNPKLDRKLRQKSMRYWLMPFGFIAGLTFSNMTNLSTFSFLGLNQIGNSLIGGLLGMGSGLLGSYVASASINLNRNKEIRSILNFNKVGKWMILLESQVGYELPWIIMKESGAIDMIFLDN